MQVRRIVLHRKGEKLRDINRHLRLLIRLKALGPRVYKGCCHPNMLIGPQNLTLSCEPRPGLGYVVQPNAAGRDPGTVTLVELPRAKTAETVRLAATEGVTDFGENYLKKPLPKMDRLADLPSSGTFIGSNPSNKTRAIAERFDWVHSVDRLNVARRLSEQRPFHAQPLNVAIQVALVLNRPREASHRMSCLRWRGRWPNCRAYSLRGLMCVPPPQPSPQDERCGVRAPQSRSRA